MATKAAPADIQGFSSTQFGDPADWTAYLQAILDAVALEVADQVGQAAYDAATAGLTFKRLKQAEIYFTEAELWRRLEAFERANVHTGRSAETAETIGSRLLANAEAAEARAWAELAKITGRTEGAGGLAVGLVQSGPFEEVDI